VGVGAASGGKSAMALMVVLLFLASGWSRGLNSEPQDY